MQIRLHKTGGHHCAILKEEEGGNEEQKYDGQSFIMIISANWYRYIGVLVPVAMLPRRGLLAPLAAPLSSVFFIELVCLFLGYNGIIVVRSICKCDNKHEKSINHIINRVFSAFYLL